MRQVFFSDVHLVPGDAAGSRRLVRFLEREAAGADEVYILGDLFDYWIGPKHLHLPDYREAVDALRALVRDGTRVVLICGNRDFYMRGFAEATGVDAAPGRTVHRLTVAGRRVCLCHGDFLEGRRGLGFLIQRLIRTRLVEEVWTRLPTPLARAGARFYRWLSERKKRRPVPDGPVWARRSRPRPLAPYGLCRAQVAEEFDRGTEVLVCGHVHRAQHVTEPVPGREGVLYTLADWSDGESYLEVEDGRWRLRPDRPEP